jgi:hypothetical protein
MELYTFYTLAEKAYVGGLIDLDTWRDIRALWGSDEQKRQADRVDGYDRDDFGESPDY